MSKHIDIELVKADFMLYWCGKVQDLTSLRKTKMSQQEMADLTDKSIKTIQRFEKYKCFDPELMYLYKEILTSVE
jgi:predicted transcriptional regulator